MATVIDHEPAPARRPVSGAYKVDISGGQRIGRVSPNGSRGPTTSVSCRSPSFMPRSRRAPGAPPPKGSRPARSGWGRAAVFAEQFRRYFRKAWLPRSGTMLNRRAMTAAVIESREFVNGRRWTDSQLLLPPGERIYVSSGADDNDHREIWRVLDEVRARNPQMVLLHGASRTGAERIAALWAAQRGVPQVPFVPDFTRHSRAAALFKRNDKVLATMPRGIIIFPRRRHPGQSVRQGPYSRHRRHRPASAMIAAAHPARERAGPFMVPRRRTATRHAAASSTAFRPTGAVRLVARARLGPAARSWPAR